MLLTYAGNEVSLDDVRDNEKLHFVKGDIGDQALSRVFNGQVHDLDTIVNFAAESHVDRSISGPDVFIETNIVGTHNLLKAARNIWID